MLTLKPEHPSPEKLVAFDRGKLSASERAAVEEHLVGCSSCCRLLEGVGDDSFVAKVRAAGDTFSSLREPLRAPRDLPFHRRAGSPGDRNGGSDTPGPGASAPKRPGAEMAATLDGPDPVEAALAGHSRYRIRKKVAAGGMGVVYLAEHRLMRRDVALKVINRELLSAPAAVARFTQEVKAAGRLEHPNIIRAYDAEQVGDTVFLVMEYVDGRSLAEVIAKKKRLSVVLACHLARQAALGLQHAHEKGMVHRDVKPQNMIVTAKGVLKLLDFGLARVVSESRPAEAVTQAGELMGTPDYVAPEQVGDPRTADIRSDIYGLGCTLYHMLAGHPPFPGGKVMQKLARQVLTPPRPLREIRDDVPPELEAVVARMIAKDPAQRYATPAKVAQALLAFLPKPAPRPEPISAPAGAKSPKEVPASAPTKRWHADGKPSRTPIAGWLARVPRRPAVIAAVAAALLAVVGVAGLVVYSVKTPDGGVVEIVADEKDFEVAFKQGGKEIEVVDVKKREKLTLKAGTNQMELKKGKERLVLEADSFTLKRGGVVKLRVTRKPPGPKPPGPGLAPPPPPPPSSPLPPGMTERFGEFRVNTTTDDHQAAPKVAMDAKSRFVVVWQSEGQDGEGWGIYGQRFDADGKRLGAEFRVNTTTKGQQSRPQLSMDAAGNFLVAWAGRGKSGLGVYAQRYDAKGEPQGEEFQVNQTPGAHQQATGMAVDAKGNFFITWAGAPKDYDAYVRRIDAEGRLGPEIKVNTRKSVGSGESRIAVRAGGEFAVAFNGDSGEVFVQHFNADGSRLGEPYQVNITESGQQSVAGAAFDGKGELVVVWREGGPHHGGKIYARRYDPGRTSLDRKEQAAHAQSGVNGGPCVARSARGDYLISWASEGEDGLRDVFTRWFGSKGEPIGAPFRVNATTAGHQEQASAAMGADGLCVIVWCGKGPGDELGIFARGFRLPTPKD
jgi:predicted Ser/Thr protein kinase